MAFFDNCLFESAGYDDTNVDLDQELEDAGIETNTDDIDALPTEESAFMIDSEFVRECYKLESSMYITDIMIESACMEGANADVLVENALTDLLDKCKDGILKLWDKFTAWLRKVQASVRAFMNGCKVFLKKNSKESLKDKLPKIDPEVKYSAYPNLMGKGVSRLGDYMKNALKSISDVSVDKLDAIADNDVWYDTAIQKIANELKIPKAQNINDIGSLATQFQKTMVGEEETDKVLKDIGDGSVIAMYDTLDKAKDIYLAITNAESETKKNIKKAIDTLNKLKKDANEENTKKIHAGVKYNNFLVRCTSRIASTYVNITTQEMKQCGRLLKQIANASEAPKNGEEKKENASASFASGFSFFDKAYEML